MLPSVVSILEAVKTAAAGGMQYDHQQAAVGGPRFGASGVMVSRRRITTR